MYDRVSSRKWERVVSHFFQVFLVFVSCKDDHQHIEHANEYEGDVDRLVFGKISIGEDITPVDRCWQHEKTTCECCQMRRKALCDVIVG